MPPIRESKIMAKEYFVNNHHPPVPKSDIRLVEGWIPLKE